VNQIALYPLRFEPIYPYRLWCGRRLANLLSAPLPGDGPIGEAWLLSDREDHPSRVANGNAISCASHHRQLETRIFHQHETT
jgi:mannose-6-phosphate isomerase class I